MVLTTNSRALPGLGIIAEDRSDVDSVLALVRKIAATPNVRAKHFVGKGCGKIRRKCHAWSKQLKQRGCSVLILVHDLDNKNLADLQQALTESLAPCPIEKHLICIPVQEYESWLLADPSAIRVAMNLRSDPHISGMPEDISSPKEYLGDTIRRASDGKKLYLNTKHNVRISEELSIENARSRCPSFRPFVEFVTRHYTATQRP